MATGRFPVRVSQGYNPSVDARNTQETFLLNGRNFTAMPLGYGSMFGNRKLSSVPLGQPLNVQGKRVQDRTFVFTDDAILTWRRSAPFMWEILWLHGGEYPTPQEAWLPWSAVFFAEHWIFGHPYRGLLVSPFVPDSDSLHLERKSDLDYPGITNYPEAMIVIRNRLILISDEIQWSNTEDFSDFTPGPGGAGFQPISSFVQGTFLAVTGSGDRFIVWTTGGGILVEYIGGAAVWRFSTLPSIEEPLTPWATVDISNGASVFFGRHGTIITVDGRLPEGWSQAFNEFFISYLKDHPSQRTFFRVEYDVNTQTLFISESSDRQTYYKSFVWQVTRDRWGEFNERHYGFLPLTNELFGFVDDYGIVRYLDASLYTRETDPAIADGLNLYLPHHEYNMITVSSSLTSNSVVYDPTDIMPIFEPLWTHYCPVLVDVPASPTLMGMDSWIEIGYLRPDSVSNSADDELEVQELLIGSVPIAADPEWTEFATAARPELFFPEEEDYDSDPIITADDIVEDWGAMTGSEDWVYDASTEDYLYLMGWEYDYVIEEVVDEMVASGDEDYMGEGIAYPILTYDLSLSSNMDGIRVEPQSPSMALFRYGSQLFTTLSPGSYHRVRLSADALYEFFQLRAMEVTLQYEGETN